MIFHHRPPEKLPVAVVMLRKLLREWRGENGWQPRCGETMSRGPEKDQLSYIGALGRYVNSLTAAGGD